MYIQNWKNGEWAINIIRMRHEAHNVLYCQAPTIKFTAQRTTSEWTSSSRKTSQISISSIWRSIPVTHIISYYYQHFPYCDIVRPVLQARGGGPPRHLQPELGRVLQVHGDQGGQPGHRQNCLLPARHRGVQGRTYSFHDLLTQQNNGKSNAIFFNKTKN